MYEKTIQELAERRPDVVFPGCGFRVVGRQVVVTGGAADLLLEDANGTLWIVELKRDRLQPAHVAQVQRYATEIRGRFSDRTVCLMLAGPAVGPGVATQAAAAGVHLHRLDMDRLRLLALEFGLTDGSARPRMSGSPVRPSKPRGPGMRRVADPARDAHQRDLDAAFPPGSIMASSPPEVVRQYWATASPRASGPMREVAAQLTFGVLRAVSSSAVSNRASAWTVLRRGDGLVLAAIEPKVGACHFSTLCPRDLAASLAAASLVSVHQERNGGKWITCRHVGREVPVEQALTWFQKGLVVLES